MQNKWTCSKEVNLGRKGLRIKHATPFPHNLTSYTHDHLQPGHPTDHHHTIHPITEHIT